MVTVMDLMFGLQNLRGYTVDYSVLSIYIYLSIYLSNVVQFWLWILRKSNTFDLQPVADCSTFNSIYINIQISRLSRTTVE